MRINDKKHLTYYWADDYTLTDHLIELLEKEILPKKTGHNQLRIIVKAIECAADEQRNHEQVKKGSNTPQTERKLLLDLKKYLNKSLSILEKMSNSEEELIDQHYYLLNKEWLSPLEKRKTNEVLYKPNNHVETVLIQITDSLTYEILAKIHASVESRIHEHNDGYIKSENQYTKSLEILAKGFKEAYPDYLISDGENTPFFKLSQFLFQRVLNIYSSPRRHIQKVSRILSYNKVHKKQ